LNELIVALEWKECYNVEHPSDEAIRMGESYDFRWLKDSWFHAHLLNRHISLIIIVSYS